ncbi:hypothetical protein JCM14635_35180 [Megalodesulfovibrio paquesii]
MYYNHLTISSEIKKQHHFSKQKAFETFAAVFTTSLSKYELYARELAKHAMNRTTDDQAMVEAYKAWCEAVPPEVGIVQLRIFFDDDPALSCKIDELEAKYKELEEFDIRKQSYDDFLNKVDAIRLQYFAILHHVSTSLAKSQQELLKFARAPWS